MDVGCLKKEFVKKKLILKPQQRFKSERYNAFTEVISKIALSSSDDKRMQSIDSLETHVYGISKNLMLRKKKIKRNNMINQCNLFNFDYITKKKHKRT